MNQEERSRFIELAKLSGEKGVPNGWVYVGEGREGGLGFGRCLGYRKVGLKIWSIDQPPSEGENSSFSFCCPIEKWNKAINPKPPGRFFVSVPTPELNLAVFEKLKSLGYKTISPYESFKSKSILGVDYDGTILYGNLKDATHLGYVKISLDDLFSRKSLTIQLPIHAVLNENSAQIGGTEVSKEKLLEFCNQIQEFYKYE